jgi:hypothetical protein
MDVKLKRGGVRDCAIAPLLESAINQSQTSKWSRMTSSKRGFIATATGAHILYSVAAERAVRKEADAQKPTRRQDALWICRSPRRDS